MSEAPTRFLLIDDNPHDRELTLRQLRREFPGCQVEQVTALSGFEGALERGEFDLVITDYHLHWSDGLTVLQAVKARCPDCPVLMFTGTGTEEMAVAAMRAGLDDYIVKSVAHFVRVSAAARAALDHAGGRRALEAARDALGRSEEGERRFRERLTTLHTVTNELCTVDSFDALCRSAVELGRSRLGFDRLSLWFVGEEPETVRGSFGVDEQGRIRDERDCVVPICETTCMNQILAGKVPSASRTVSPLRNDRGGIIGSGSTAVAPLWDGEQTVGCLVTDNLLRQKPITERDRDVLRLYASALGHLCSRLRAYEALKASEEGERRFREQLTVLHEVNNSLTTADTFDELCRHAIELGRGRLGFERLGLWFVGDDPDVVVGSFGVDESGEVRDERRRRVAVEATSAVGRVLKRRVPSVLQADAPLCDDGSNVVGRGHGAVAGLWDGREVIGCIIADTLLSGEPIAERQCDLLVLYASALGHLCSRKRAREQTRLLSQHLRQAQKMEAIGRLAGGVAHDFNNLLTAISGYAEMLLASLGKDDPARHEVREIREAGARAAALTRQLLAFSRRQMLQPTALDLNTVVADMGEMLGRVIGEHVELVTRLAPGLGAIEADRSQIEQVIVNLAVNARDAMPEGGTLAVTTANADLGGAFAREHVDVEPGPYVLLSVSDTGRGMSAETLSRAFEPFFTTKGPGEGTGLGLATVHGIVKQSGGHVAARSEPGKGTTIDVYLPRTEAAAPVVRRRPLPDAALHGSETILLVEDEDMVRDLARTVLEQHGYTVLEARDGAEALRICEQADQPIHLAVTDVVMPRMDGAELAARLRTLSPDTRILYISGYADHTIVRHGTADPATPFLHKPFTPTALAAKVREVLDTPQG